MFQVYTRAQARFLSMVDKLDDWIDRHFPSYTSERSTVYPPNQRGSSSMVEEHLCQGDQQHGIAMRALQPNIQVFLLNILKDLNYVIFRFI